DLQGHGADGLLAAQGRQQRLAGWCRRQFGPGKRDQDLRQDGEYRQGEELGKPFHQGILKSRAAAAFEAGQWSGGSGAADFFWPCSQKGVDFMNQISMMRSHRVVSSVGRAVDS